MAINEVETLLTSLNLDKYLDSINSNKIDGKKLCNCVSENHLCELLQAESTEISALFDFIEKYQEKGVPLHVLQGI